MKLGPISLLFIVLLLIFTLVMLYYDSLIYFYYCLTRKKRIGRKLKKIAKDNDYILLNDLHLYFNETQYVKVDYLLFSNKYIYVISARTLHGDVDGKDIDEKWRLYRGSKLFHIENPLKTNSTRMKIVSKLTEIDKENFINMVVISNTAIITSILTSNPNDYVVSEKNLRNTIKDIERFSKFDDFSTKFMEKEANLIYNYSQKCKEKTS
ncbi:MAG: NERD domain-containing protein [Erysipelotrichaceae bacterium]|nr:NERD domain-containing protein [Erysipelotrichaceae bacterium]